MDIKVLEKLDEISDKVLAMLSAQDITERERWQTLSEIGVDLKETADFELEIADLRAKAEAELERSPENIRLAVLESILLKLIVRVPDRPVTLWLELAIEGVAQATFNMRHNAVLMVLDAPHYNFEKATDEMALFQMLEPNSTSIPRLLEKKRQRDLTYFFNTAVDLLYRGKAKDAFKTLKRIRKLNPTPHERRAIDLPNLEQQVKDGVWCVNIHNMKERFYDYVQDGGFGPAADIADKLDELLAKSEVPIDWVDTSAMRVFARTAKIKHALKDFEFFRKHGTSTGMRNQIVILRTCIEPPITNEDGVNFRKLGQLTRWKKAAEQKPAAKGKPASKAKKKTAVASTTTAKRSNSKAAKKRSSKGKAKAKK
jgi:hypothetical protein